MLVSERKKKIMAFVYIRKITQPYNSIGDKLNEFPIKLKVVG